jgi:hypothetical protein
MPNNIDSTIHRCLSSFDLPPRTSQSATKVAFEGVARLRAPSLPGLLPPVSVCLPETGDRLDFCDRREVGGFASRSNTDLAAAVTVEGHDDSCCSAYCWESDQHPKLLRQSTQQHPRKPTCHRTEHDPKNYRSSEIAKRRRLLCDSFTPFAFGINTHRSRVIKPEVFRQGLGAFCTHGVEKSLQAAKIYTLQWRRLVKLTGSLSSVHPL